jgi:hypothetical protein
MTIIDSIRAEYLRYKALAEAAIGQLNDDAGMFQEISAHASPSS